MNIKRLLCCLALLLAAPMVLADTPASNTPVQRDATTFTEAQVNEITSSDVLNRMLAGYKRLGDQTRFGWTLARLSTLNPDSGDLRMMLAVHYAEQGDKSKTYDLLLKMKEQGYGVDLKDDPRFAKVTGTDTSGNPGLDGDQTAWADLKVPLGAMFAGLSTQTRKLQTGQVRTYALTMTIGSLLVGLVFILSQLG